MVVAPIAGALSDRIGGRPIMSTGLALQAVGLAWIASVSSAGVGYESLVTPFVLSGIGMGMFFAPTANVVLSAVRRRDEGKASGTNSTVREVGGVLGVAALASIFARNGGYESSQAFADGLVPALWIGALVVGVGALVALLIPRNRRTAEVIAVEPATDDRLVPQLDAA
jgi:MFS family permease